MEKFSFHLKILFIQSSLRLLFCNMQSVSTCWESPEVRIWSHQVFSRLILPSKKWDGRESGNYIHSKGIKEVSTFRTSFICPLSQAKISWKNAPLTLSRWWKMKLYSLHANTALTSQVIYPPKILCCLWDSPSQFSVACREKKKSTEKSVAAAGRSGREERVIKSSLCADRHDLHHQRPTQRPSHMAETCTRHSRLDVWDSAAGQEHLLNDQMVNCVLSTAGR